MLRTASSMGTVAILLTYLSASMTLAQDPKKYGQFAPPDAFLDGAPLAYYGSENQWSRRMFSAQRADTSYKRSGQRQLLAILDGDAQRASQWCRQRIATDPNDLESRFMLTVALCQMDEIDAALESMQQAVASGLPLARFLAGPRDLLQPLTNTDAFRALLKESQLKLIHGPMLGRMTDHSVACWVRTVNESQVRVRVFDREDSSTPTRIGKSKTTRQRDYTTIVEVSGLQSATEYYYEVWVDGRPCLDGQRLRFQTFPRLNTPAKFSVAFGGGAGYTPQHERIWDTIAERRPMALLMLGDNVYIDLPEQPGPFHRYTYYRRQSRPEFRRLVQSTPVYSIWDDHDSAIDDVWLGPFVDRPVWKRPTLDLFSENWINPAYGTDQWPGCWHTLRIANVDFFMLDCRNYRTNPFARERTMLGPVQKRWLLEQLQNSRAEFKVIVSSVPWAPGAKPGSRDTWDGFPEEREEIFSWIEAKRIAGVLLLSADRHRSDAWQIKRPNGASFYEFMSSRLTNIHTHERMPQAIFSYNDTCSFGLLTLDTRPQRPRVLYQIVNLEGEIVYSLPLDKSVLNGIRE